MSKDNAEAFATYEFDLPPIRGFPELRWAGKRPFKSTQYFPAQKKESYGDPTDGWWNRIFWGDNLQVTAHLLREFRGKVDLVYIDPPFDSGADYKKIVKIKANSAVSDNSNFEEKQYKDIWSNDDYLQFMYERLCVLRELISDTGSIMLHCDSGRNYALRCILDEVFGPSNFINEIVWRRKGGSALGGMGRLSSATDTILWYSKSFDQFEIQPLFLPASQEYIDQQFRLKDNDGRKFMVNVMRSPSPRPNLRYDYKGYKTPPNGWSVPIETMKRMDDEGRLYFPESKENQIYKKIYLDEYKGQVPNNLWSDIPTLKGTNREIVGYPTQKPEALLQRIFQIATKPGALVFDSFMGSGTTQSVAMKLGRRFLGADINLGAIETTIKRLNNVREDLEARGVSLGDFYEGGKGKIFTGFEVYNVNNYDLFRNPVEAKALIREAMELQPLPPSSAFDGQREGYLVKIMPVNRIATRQDLNEVINGLDFKAFERRQAEAPNKPVERIHLVCMGHEPDLGPALQKEAKPFDIEVMVTDLIRDKAHLHFKKASDARLAIEKSELVIKGFYPMNLLQKLSLESDGVEDWRQLVESVKVDFHYDGAVLTPAIVDAPNKDELVAGRYAIPADAATIRVKITDLLSESWEGDIENG